MVYKGITIINTFQKIIDKANHTPNKIWVYKGSEFYNRLFKSFLQNNDKEMYLTHKARKSVVAERVIRTSKKKNF